MRAPVNSLRAELRRTKRQAREARAVELYGLEGLRDRLTGRAAAGYDHAVIDAPDGLDLRDTVAAKAAMAWLAEMHLDADWEARAGSVGTDGVSSWSLRVSWKRPALHPPPQT